MPVLTVPLVRRRTTLGPTIGALRFWSGSSDRCEAGARCTTQPLEQHGQLLGAYVLALRFSVSAGSRM